MTPAGIDVLACFARPPALAPGSPPGDPATGTARSVFGPPRPRTPPPPPRPHQGGPDAVARCARPRQLPKVQHRPTFVGQANRPTNGAETNWTRTFPDLVWDVLIRRPTPRWPPYRCQPALRPATVVLSLDSLRSLSYPPSGVNRFRGLVVSTSTTHRNSLDPSPPAFRRSNEVSGIPARGAILHEA